jgi:hypothetical protein
MRLNAAQQAEIAGIRDRNNGVLHAENVLEFARNPATALHDHADITWDDSADAEKWRIHWARSVVVASVTIVPHPDSGKVLEVRSFVSTPDIRAALGTKSGYMATDVVASDPVLVRSVVVAAIGAARAMQKRFGQFEMILRPVDRLLIDLQDVLRQLDAAPDQDAA